MTPRFAQLCGPWEMNPPSPILSVFPGMASDDYVEIDRAQIKKVTRYACTAYKEGTISQETFEQVVEFLLAFYLERSLEDTLLPKVLTLTQKFL